MSTNNNNINDIINNENVNNNNNNNNEDNGNEVQQQPPIINIQQQIQQRQAIEEQRQLLEQVINQFKHQPQPIITPPQSPRQPIPITSSTITNTIKKTLQGSNIDDTDHHLLQKILYPFFTLTLVPFNNSTVSNSFVHLVLFSKVEQFGLTNKNLQTNNNNNNIYIYNFHFCII
ncbi:hypothetical protein ACTFIZ_008738 [Dictyostelium cf. discoideum]